MAQIDAHAPGSFCWFELATTDQNAAKRFYTELFGWEVDDFPMGPDEHYTLFQRNGRDASAAFTMRPEQRQQGVPPFWLTYIAVANVDESAARAAALGGQIVAPPFDVMQMGRMTVVADPGGAHFALWQAGTNAGTGVTREPGTANWIEISVPDRAVIMPFYEGLFGWKFVTGKDKVPATPTDSYPHIMHGDDFIGGLPGPAQRDPNAPPHFLIYFSVEDVAASTKKAVALGGKAFVDTMDIGENGRISVMADPQGAMFALHEAP